MSHHPDKTASAQWAIELLGKKLLSLPPETRVWPGHAYGETDVSTLAHERETNPYITDFL